MVKESRLKVCVMGLGNIGLSVASYVSEYFLTAGYDVKEQAIAKALARKVDASATVESADIYIIVVSTYYRNDAPDMSTVDSCCSKISGINPNALVCFESTLFVGTARKNGFKIWLKICCCMSS